MRAREVGKVRGAIGNLNSGAKSSAWVPRILNREFAGIAVVPEHVRLGLEVEHLG